MYISSAMMGTYSIVFPWALIRLYRGSAGSIELPNKVSVLALPNETANPSPMAKTASSEIHINGMDI
jgi:hypothetical protein